MLRHVHLCGPPGLRLGLALAMVLTLGMSNASADWVFNFSGSDTDGPVSGTLDASISGSTIKVTLTDTSAPNGSTWSIGQAMADVGFQVTGLNGAATLTSVSGTLVNQDGSTSNLNLSNLTWTYGSKPSKSAIALGTIAWTYDGISVGGAPPNELIANGAYESLWGSSLFTTSHAPDILTSVTFTFNAPGVTNASVISNVLAAFGTQPEVVLSGTPSQVVPAPSSAVLLGIGLAVFLAGWYLTRAWRRQAAAVA